RITAHLDKQRAEVGILNIKVVVVYVDRLVARELKLPVDLLALEGLRFLLRHTDENDPILYAALLPDLVGYLVLTFLVIELVRRNLMLFGHCLHRLAELLRYLAPHHWRWDWFPQLLPHECHQPARRCQWPDVPVQVQPVQTLHFQR